ncbi:MAG: DUF2341 domain-containing protein [Verrucomicrobia bacterium]|nr:DUF2341 domain-containing protein [Verrucomicrobiota bacterium]
MNHTALLTTVAMLAGVSPQAIAQYQGWQHSGSLAILTTPDGANLPAAAAEENFPLLVRLDQEWFDFSQAQAMGGDLRFAAAGKALAYQIDDWDAAAGTASIWVRVPSIKGNARQELKMFWGKADAPAESSGTAVFNESNGFLSVWHMNEPLKDEAGTLVAKDTGTTPAAGMIGKSRHFPGGKGIAFGENITTYPTGSSPHTTEAWFRGEQSNATVLAWGNEAGQGKVMLQFFNPPHMKIECYFSGADVAGASTLATSQWIHVVHTYQHGDSRLYVNGVLDGVSTSTGAPLALKSPARLYLGGWYDNYRFVGEMDEVRISKVTRSADWVKLQYANQQSLQTLVGPLVQAGTDFAVSAKSISMLEGKRAAVTAKAGGAQKIYWILKRGDQETIAAVDRFHFTLDAGRVTGDQALTLRFKAVYPNTVRVLDIPVTIREDIPDPVFTLKSPTQWNGRETIEVVPQISNLPAMQAKGAGSPQLAWNIAGIAVIKDLDAGKLILRRSQNSGTMAVTATLNNGGKPVTQTIRIAVKEPVKDPWVQRTPDQDEKPVDNQFYARDDKNEGTLYYHGILTDAADAVILNVYADDKLIKTETRKPTADHAYAFAIKLKAGLIKYKVEFGSKRGTTGKVLHTAANLVCGDAYLIEGQSNAVSTDWGADKDEYTSEWIRSFGSMEGDVSKGWGKAVRKEGGQWQIGYWGMDLAKHLVESQKIPICIINGAVGGTRIDQHQKNPATPTDATTIYGRMLQRVRQARLTHGIRGVLWHQGEADQGTDGPDGGYGWETYQQYFVDMSAAWKQDMPNLQHYYVYQIWPNACSQGGTRNSDKLRDLQRVLPRLYSNMSVMSTLGIKPEGGCHYPAAGYAEMARLMGPLVERDNYGKAVAESVTAPDLRKATYPSARQDEIVLEFDQPVAWIDALAGQFYLDGEAGKVASGTVSGNVLKLKLTAPATAKTITYVQDRRWDPKTLLYGKNGIAALTFCEVAVEATP